MKNEYPDFVRQCLRYGGFLVGSAAKGDRAAADWDILIPYRFWYKVARMIPGTAEPNKFGGWRFVLDGEEFDVWPDSLDRYLFEATNYEPTASAVGLQYTLTAEKL